MHRHSGEPSFETAPSRCRFFFLHRQANSRLSCHRIAAHHDRTLAAIGSGGDNEGLRFLPAPMSDQRKILRSQLRQARRGLDVPTRLDAADALARQLLALPFNPTHGFVAGYWAGDGEIALHRWQTRLPAGLTYCLPMLAGDVLRFAPWRPGQALTTNRYGIPEPDIAVEDALQPQAMALVVTPLVGFDGHCRRLGMGGGWYDRSFAFRLQQAPAPWLVGAAFDCQQVEALPGAHWDVPLDAVCTPSTTHLAPRTP